MSEIKDRLSHYFNKEYNYILDSGKKAITESLKFFKSRKVAIPGLACEDLVISIRNAGCEIVFVDINSKLQIDLHKLPETDTVLVPHTFGIITDIEDFRRTNTSVTIIEDCSQAGGYRNFGKYADVVVTSAGRSKWHNVGYGGVLSINTPVPWLRDIEFDEREFMRVFDESDVMRNLESRHNQFINIVKSHNLQFVDSEINSYHRAMYFQEPHTDRPVYARLTDDPALVKTNEALEKLNWISIHYERN